VEIAILIGGTSLYAVAIEHALSGGDLVMTTAIACLCYLLVISPWGIVTTYICERFPTQIRASGYGIGYSVEVVIPAFSGCLHATLQAMMPYVYTPVGADCAFRRSGHRRRADGAGNARRGATCC
jgi:hypothetical protein